MGKCFYHNCDAVSRPSKLSFFQIPTDHRRAIWLMHGNVADKVLPKKPTFCEQHFYKKDVQFRCYFKCVHREALPISSPSICACTETSWDATCYDILQAGKAEIVKQKQKALNLVYNNCNYDALTAQIKLKLTQPVMKVNEVKPQDTNSDKPPVAVYVNAKQTQSNGVSPVAVKPLSSVGSCLVPVKPTKPLQILAMSTSDCSSGDATGHSSPYTSTKLHLYKPRQMLKRHRLIRCPKRLKKIQENNLRASVEKHMEKSSEEVRSFVLSQIFHNKSHSWNPKEKEFAMKLFRNGQNCYKHLLNIGFKLPAISTVFRWHSQKSKLNNRRVKAAKDSRIEEGGTLAEECTQDAQAPNDLLVEHIEVCS